MPRERRKFVQNFIVLRETQVPFIKNMLAILASSTLISSAVILAAYFFASRSGYLYFMSEDLERPLIRKSLLGIALPGLLAAEVITLVIGFWVALLASRRLAVPLYKLEQWARALAEGNLSAPLTFREEAEYKAIIEQCNLAGERFKTALQEIDAAVNSPSSAAPNEESLQKVRTILKGFDYRT